jgi:hypothetical protein
MQRLNGLIALLLLISVLIIPVLTWSSFGFLSPIFWVSLAFTLFVLYNLTSEKNKG